MSIPRQFDTIAALGGTLRLQLTSSRSVWWWQALVVVLAACGEERAPFAPIGAEDDAEQLCTGEAETIDTDEEEPPEVNCPDEERTLLCFGQWAAHCDAEGDLVELVNCREHDQVCAPHKCGSASDCTGCRDCLPGSVRCGGAGELRVCREDGSGYEVAELCDEAAGEFCSMSSRSCEDLCAAAEATSRTSAASTGRSRRQLAAESRRQTTTDSASRFPSRSGSPTRRAWQRTS